MYVFEKDEGGTDNWGQVIKKTASDAAGGDSLGYTAVCLDDDVMLAGSPFDTEQGTSSGSAYFFDKDLGGTDNWGEDQKIVAIAPLQPAMPTYALNYHRARFMDPVQGTWVTRDPLWYNRVALSDGSRSERHQRIDVLSHQNHHSLKRRFRFGPKNYQFLFGLVTSSIDPSGLTVLDPNSADRGILAGCNDYGNNGNYRPNREIRDNCCGCKVGLQAIVNAGPFDVVEYLEHGSGRPCGNQWCSLAGGLGWTLNTQTSPSICDAINQNGWLMLGGCGVADGNPLAGPGGPEPDICTIARLAACNSKNIVVCGCSGPNSYDGPLEAGDIQCGYEDDPGDYLCARIADDGECVVIDYEQAAGIYHPPSTPPDVP